MNKKDIANMIANIKRIGKLIVVTCPKCKERLKDKIYGLCEECWDDYMDWSWFEMLAGNDFSTKRYENIN
jgi:hypothetical protein